MDQPKWRAGFELELILGDLDEDRFSDYMDVMGPMDTASAAFCQAVAKRLTLHTGIRWSAPVRAFPSAGFYVVPEYNLDPLDWPRDRCAGVELLTPPLPLDAAELIRRRIADAIEEMDLGFDPFPGELSDQCAWHINVDAGKLSLDPSRFSLATDELAVLAKNRRLFTPYTAIQRHSFGARLLRHLKADPDGDLFAHSGLSNFLCLHAGRAKRYAANFAKLQRGYVELRHFSMAAFFTDEPLDDLLQPMTSAFQLTWQQTSPLEEKLLAEFAALNRWLTRYRESIGWNLEQSIVYPLGKVTFDGETLGDIGFNGSVDLTITDGKTGEIAAIRDIDLADISEGVALLALDLAELRNLGVQTRTGSRSFNRAVQSLSKDIQALRC